MHSELNSPADLGRLVRAVRQGRGLSQVVLAEELGVSQRWLSELEIGRGKHFDERFFRVLTQLGIQLAGTATPAAQGPQAPQAAPDLSSDAAPAPASTPNGEPS